MLAPTQNFGVIVCLNRKSTSASVEKTWGSLCPFPA
jgi:hypothetical protein